MTEVRTMQAGWYPDPKMPGTMRYWDGSVWTDHVAPVASPPKDDGIMRALTIAFGVLIAVGVVWFVYGAMHATDDLECANDNSDRALSGEPLKDCG